MGSPAYMVRDSAGRWPLIRGCDLHDRTAALITGGEKHFYRNKPLEKQFIKDVADLRISHNHRLRALAVVLRGMDWSYRRSVIYLYHTKYVVTKVNNHEVIVRGVSDVHVDGYIYRNKSRILKELKS